MGHDTHDGHGLIACCAVRPLLSGAKTTPRLRPPHLGSECFCAGPRGDELVVFKQRSVIPRRVRQQIS